MYEISNNITIEAIDQLMYSWDVDQNSPNRIAHQGAFLGCIGDFPQNSIYLRYDISAREIEKLIVAEYRYRSIKRYLRRIFARLEKHMEQSFQRFSAKYN